MAAQIDECFILIKAQPHRSSKYYETVCCAGVGRDQKWRRQYPVPFRILSDTQKFKRWNWIRYKFTRSKEDPRTESQKVIPESLELIGEIKKGERASFLDPLIRASFAEADGKRESLTLIRPKTFALEAKEKSALEIMRETVKHGELANQLSMFDSTARPLTPCPMRFIAKWRDQDGKERTHECDDWETAAAFSRFERAYGRVEALRSLRGKYEDEYMRAGLALGFSTHKRRNAEFGTQNQWLLVAMIRLDEIKQPSLSF
ncbi:hypothetical protein [Sphingosinithalassobacter sp. CS137]|uniref:hypothetical protein n=1 Tax=Sphingosinithalassobacter sp. CS137 TaxID=2762748 RepID=UPI00165DD087|nr:hypothetical protein [Sphingosinithalassobacter sp. CS137]